MFFNQCFNQTSSKTLPNKSSKTSKKAETSTKSSRNLKQEQNFIKATLKQIFKKLPRNSQQIPMISPTSFFP
jgi:hypothetical protein